MGTKYSSNSASGYNATPPADDGTVSEANKGKWSTIKEKLADPVKTLADTINSELVTHFDNGPVAYTTNQTLGLTHYGQVIQVSGSGVTLTLSDASTLGAGWNCEMVSTDTSNTVTVARATASNTINETSSNISLLPLNHVRAVVNAAATGFLVSSVPRTTKKNRVQEETQLVGVSLWGAEGAAVASTADCNIWTTDGNTVHITGTTQIDDWGTAPQAGAWKRVIFDDALTLNYNSTTNDLPGDADITTAANDSCIVYARSASSYQIFDYTQAAAGIVSSGANVQTFESSGTWTKPLSYTSTARVLLQAWGGGGSGGKSNNSTACSGGGGGGYVERWVALSAMGSTETITIGAGGAAQTNNGQDGNVGGDTTIGSLVTAYGGGPGDGTASSTDSITAGGGNALGAGTVSAKGSPGFMNMWSGADGGAVVASAVGNGSAAIFGGGGGGADLGGTAGTGGSSLYGGAGGAGGGASVDGNDGTQPGGGGGGSSNAAGESGAGGAGKVIITVFA
jgi:hypothetical protein